jgi:hypothetical protein
MSQQRWRAKEENVTYWRGEGDRVRAWRRTHPGYWKRKRRKEQDRDQEQRNPLLARAQCGKRKARTLREMRLPKDPMMVGLISHLAESTLQDEIAAVCRFFVTKGNEILGKKGFGKN